MTINSILRFAQSGGLPFRLVCAAACACACHASSAQARASRDAGGPIDLGPYQSHVDIPEIAGVPGGPGSWLPSTLTPIDPLSDPLPTRVIMPEPIPVPPEIPRVEESPLLSSGPKSMIPAVIMPTGAGLGGSDGSSVGVTPGAIPAPGAGVLLGLSVVALGGRRRR